MRTLFIAIALSFFAIMALAGTATEREAQPALAIATLPDADPVIVNMDTSKPFARNHRDGLIDMPPTRRFTDI